MPKKLRKARRTRSDDDTAAYRLLSPEERVVLALVPRLPGDVDEDAEDPDQLAEWVRQ